MNSSFPRKFRRNFFLQDNNPCRGISLSKATNGSLFPKEIVCSLLKFPSLESLSRLTNDSPAESVNGSLRPEDSSDFPMKSANGSLFQQKTVCSLSSNRVYKWQSLPVEDNLFPQQSANGSLFQQKTVCSLSHSRVYKWQSFLVEDSLFP